MVLGAQRVLFRQGPLKPKVAHNFVVIQPRGPKFGLEVPKGPYFVRPLKPEVTHNFVVIQPLGCPNGPFSSRPFKPEVTHYFADIQPRGQKFG